ncbi:hypothetical protein ABK040_011651 [Willaertia magna]
MDNQSSNSDTDDDVVIILSESDDSDTESNVESETSNDIQNSVDGAVTFEDVNGVEVPEEDASEIMKDLSFDNALNMLDKEDRENYKEINETLKKLPSMKTLKNMQLDEITVETIENNKFSENTANYYTYVLNVYMKYFRMQLAEDPEFNGGMPFPLKLNTIKQYAFYLRITKAYAHSTTIRLSYFALKRLNFKYCNDNLQSLSKQVKAFFIQLAYSVGSDQYKIRPLLNKGKEQILNAIDQSIYLDCLLSLLVMQGRSRGLRGDTLQAVKLRDITFIRSMVNKFVLLTTRFWIEKDKTVFKRKRYQTLLGNPNYKRCGNICLLLYLTHFRKVFRVNDPIYLLNLPQGHPDWQILDEYLDEPLFLSTDGKNSWSNKCMSNKMKNFCSAHKIELYSTRSLRSGLCCSLLLKYKMLHGELHSSFLEKVKEFIGWESIKEINIYKRFVTDHYSEEGILCESRVSNTMISDILSSVIEEEGCADGLLDFQFSWDGVIPLKNLKVEHLWCNSVRHSNDKFIWHLRIPGSLSCYLQLTCSEKEKRRILEEQEEAKRLKQRYHAHEAEKVYNKYYSNFITRDLDIDARNSEEGKASKSKMKVVLKYAKDKAIRLWDENTVIIYCKENNLYLDKKKWVINQNKKANKKDEYSADYYKEHAKLMEWKQQQLHNVQKEMKEKEKELKLQHLLRSKEEIAKRRLQQDTDLTIVKDLQYDSEDSKIEGCNGKNDVVKKDVSNVSIKVEKAVYNKRKYMKMKGSKILKVSISTKSIKDIENDSDKEITKLLDKNYHLYDSLGLSVSVLKRKRMYRIIDDVNGNDDSDDDQMMEDDDEMLY